MSAPYPFEEGRFEKFTGEVVHLYVQQIMTDYPGLADSLEFKMQAAQNVRSMVMQLIGWCASGRIPSRSEYETVEYPDGVWQTFKQNYMPHWFVLKYPVRVIQKKIEKTVHHYFVCPHIKLNRSDDTRFHIQFMATGTPLASRMDRGEQ